MTPARTRAAEVKPAELGQLLDFAERARQHDWSMRAALTRYAQAQPQRASDVIELMRRTEFALRPHLDAVQRDGEAVWAAVVAAGGDGDEGGEADFVVELLRAMAELDRLGDALAVWAHDRQPDRPDALVDAVVADVAERLDRLGVAREERPARPSGRAGRGV